MASFNRVRPSSDWACASRFEVMTMGRSLVQCGVAVVMLMAAASAARAQGLDQSTFETASRRATAMQSSRPAPRQVAQGQPGRRLGLRAYLLFDSNQMAASQTFDAIFGKSRFVAPGFGAEVINLWHGLFARVAVSTMKETGSRVIVAGNEVESLGIPLTIEMRPVEVGGGWRLKSVARGRLVPYVGAGMVRLRYTETSDLAETGENAAESFSGVQVFGGLEARVAPWIVTGVEVQFRSIADAIGAGGASKAFGETDLGGTTVRVLAGIGW